MLLSESDITRKKWVYKSYKCSIQERYINTLQLKVLSKIFKFKSRIYLKDLLVITLALIYPPL